MVLCHQLGKNLFNKRAAFLSDSLKKIIPKPLSAIPAWEKPNYSIKVSRDKSYPSEEKDKEEEEDQVSG